MKLQNRYGWQSKGAEKLSKYPKLLVPVSLHTVVKKKASSIQIVWLSGVKQWRAQVIIHSIDISVKREQQLQKIWSIHQASGEM